VKVDFDIDIDVADRSKVLEKINHVPASIYRNGEWIKHNSGVYLQQMPINAFNGTAVMDYKSAADFGFFKLDLLNIHVYQLVRDAEHLNHLMATEPLWELLSSEDFVNMVIHINGHFNTIAAMPEPVTSIDHMAMLLAIIRPAKRHLIGLPWDQVSKTVWDRPVDGKGYGFKRSHSLAYAHLVAVHMNLICERLPNALD
jgi:hypothetical protein